MRWPWSCPEPGVLACAISEGMTPRLRRHLDRCARCQEEWDQARQVRASARDLPVIEMGAGARGRIADRIVAAALRIDAERERRRHARI
jgi:hypothetical protein